MHGDEDVVTNTSNLFDDQDDTAELSQTSSNFFRSLLDGWVNKNRLSILSYAIRSSFSLAMSLISTQNTGKSANDILKIGSGISNRDGYVGGNDIKSAFIQLLPSDVLLAIIMLPPLCSFMFRCYPKTRIQSHTTINKIRCTCNITCFI